MQHKLKWPFEAQLSRILRTPLILTKTMQCSASEWTHIGDYADHSTKMSWIFVMNKANTNRITSKK